MRIIESLLDLCFPKFCSGCGRFGTYLCLECAKTIHFYRLPLCPGCMGSINELGVHPRCKKDTRLDGLIVVSKFDGVLKQMVTEVKYQGYFDMLHTLSLLFRTKSNLLSVTPRVIIPVPLHPQKLDERGFNQAWILAQDLSKQLSVPATDKLLRKIKPTRSQAGLKREDRLKNVSESFSCTRKLKKTDTVLLVDDVVTTGATFSACSDALKKTGAGKVYGITLAHGH